jgi:hypothetical protein
VCDRGAIGASSMLRLTLFCRLYQDVESDCTVETRSKSAAHFRRETVAGIPECSVRLHFTRMLSQTAGVGVYSTTHDKIHDTKVVMTQGNLCASSR